MDVARSLLGVVILLLIAVALSDNRRLIKPRVVISALLSQVVVGVLVLFFPLGKVLLEAAAKGVNRVLSYGHEGAQFLLVGLSVTPCFRSSAGRGLFLLFTF